MVNSQFCPEPSHAAYENLLLEVENEIVKTEVEREKEQDAFTAMTETLQTHTGEAEKAQADYAELLTTLHNLQSDLAQNRAEESRLCIEHHQHIFALAAKHKEQLNMQQALVDEAKRAFADKLNLAATANSHRDMAFTAFNVVKDKAAASEAEQQQIWQALEAEILDIDNKFSRIIHESTAKKSLAATEMETAKKTVEIATASLEEATSVLMECEEELKILNERFDEAQTEETERLTALRQEQEQQILQASQAEKDCKETYLQAKKHYEEAENIAQMATGVYYQSKDKTINLAEELRALFADSEQAANAISATMEHALAESTRVRLVYADVSAFDEELQNQLQGELVLEESYRQKILAEEIINQEYKAAATMAHNLAEDATNSRKAAGPEMQEMLGKMEESLLEAAAQADLEYQKHSQYLDLYRESYQIISEQNGVFRNAILAAENDINTYAEQCHTIDELIVSQQKASVFRAEEREQIELKIKKLKDEYDIAAPEVFELKKGMEETTAICRAAKAALDQAEQAYEIAGQYHNELTTKWQQKLEEINDQTYHAYHELEKLLSVTRDKRDKLFAMQTQRKLDLTSAQRDYRNKNSTHTAAEKNYVQVKSGAENTLAALKKRITAMVTSGKVLLSQSEDGIQAASDAYKDAVLSAAAADDAVIKTEQVIVELEKAFPNIAKEADIKQKEANDSFEQQLNKNRVIINEQMRQVAEADAVAKEAEQTMQAAKEKLAETNTILEGLLLRISALTEQKRALNDKQTLINQEFAAFKQELIEEEKRQAAEAAAEKKALDDERRRKEEEERARLREELELAENQAEAERIKLAAEKEAAAIAEQERIIRIVKGEILSKQENIALINNSVINDLLQKMQQIAKQEQQNLAELSPEDIQIIKEKIAQFAAIAKEQKTFFKAAQNSYNNIARELENAKTSRKELGQQQATFLRELDKSQQNKLDLELVLENLTKMLATADSEQSKKHLDTSLDSINQAVADNDKTIARLQNDLEQSAKQIQDCQVTIEKFSLSLNDAEEALNTTFGKWLYNENIVYKNGIRLAAITEQREQRQRMATDAAARLNAAKEQTTTATSGTERVGSIKSLGQKISKKMRT